MQNAIAYHTGSLQRELEEERDKRVDAEKTAKALQEARDQQATTSAFELENNLKLSELLENMNSECDKLQQLVDVLRQREGHYRDLVEVQAGWLSNVGSGMTHGLQVCMSAENDLTGNLEAETKMWKETDEELDKILNDVKEACAGVQRIDDNNLNVALWVMQVPLITFGVRF